MSPWRIKSRDWKRSRNTSQPSILSAWHGRLVFRWILLGDGDHSAARYFSLRCGRRTGLTWENYDTHYTERYLGLPTENAEGYRDSNVLTYASELRRPILLIHGMTDDNVYAQHSMQLSDALFNAGKPFNFLPFSARTWSVNRWSGCADRPASWNSSKLN